jgi:hypothetical protein
MAVVKYTIVSGAAPFTAVLTPSSISANTHTTIGTFQFNDVPNGNYALMVTDSNGCIFQQEITLDPLVSTTTTTVAPGNSIVIGQTNDPSLIFNINGTNRTSHYDASTTTLYMWLKTLDGKPLTQQKVINYSFTTTDGSTFLFNTLSDQRHAEVIQIVPGPLTVINGQIILKIGFIETFFQYTYIENIITPSYQIELNSTGDWLYIGVPLVDSINIYGITYIDRDNVIMNF